MSFKYSDAQDSYLESELAHGSFSIANATERIVVLSKVMVNPDALNRPLGRLD